MRLLLIRHGASLHSQRGLIAGLRACAGLTDDGFRQAHALGARLRAEGVGEGALLLSSPVLRARQTAEVLAEALGLPLEPPDCDLCELHPGDADGLTWPEHERRFGSFDLLADQQRPFAPGGESWRAFLARTERTLNRLVSVQPPLLPAGEGWGEGRPLLHPARGAGVGGEDVSGYAPDNRIADENTHSRGAEEQATLKKPPLRAARGAGAGGEVIAVTHAGFIVAAFLTLFAIPRPGSGARIDPAHASITEWHHDAGIWQLVRYNTI